MKPKFTVALIARNESKTLPRLVESLKEFQSRGGEIVLLDTGSTDGTADIARGLGCKVTEVGDKFRRVITEDEALHINVAFAKKGDENIVAAGDSLFDYSAARNYVATLAENDMLATPDCDEIYTKLDLDAINKAIDEGVQQLEYNFVFSHDEAGNDLIKFQHSKFYDRRKLEWTGVIHEVLTTKAQGEEIFRRFFEESHIKLEHWQNPETNRGHYLKGLALSVYEDPSNDRNLHYFARELMYTGRFYSALEVFQKHIDMGKWPAERSQSQIHMGECYLYLGDPQKAVHSFIDAFDTLPTRREPLIKIAEYYRNVGSVDHVIAYTAAALQIPGDNFYANFQPYYEDVPHALMYWALWEKGEYNASKRHFDQCLAYHPFRSEYLRDFRHYYELPKISIVIPTLRSSENLNRTLESIKRLNYPQDKLEVITIVDEPRIGVPKRLKEGVEKSTGDWVVYAADDMEFEPDCLIAAFKQALDNRKYFMAFHDGEVSPDEGNICTHFMIHKKLIEKIGEVFDTEFHHVGVDNLLWAKMKKMNQAMHCNRAKIIHRHFSKTGEMDDVHKIAWHEERVKADRELLAKKLEELNSLDT